jgi:hypothetical protein
VLVGHTKLVGYTEAEIKRFWSYVNKTEYCWEWNGGRDERGYGYYRFWDKVMRTHRFVYSLFYGTIPEGMMICHKCDNPCCVRPSHLFLGTALDNARDAVNKRRTGVLPPVAQPIGGVRRMGAAAAVHVRKAYKAGEAIAAIARRHRVSRGAIHRVLRRESYAWISDEDTQPGTPIPPVTGATGAKGAVTEQTFMSWFGNLASQELASGAPDATEQPPQNPSLQPVTTRNH